MKVVLQRVRSASVEAGNEITGAINKGVLLLVGVHNNDGKDEIKWICDKILKLRIFEDDEGKMNRSVTDINGEILIVSQFTLYADVKKGTRPGFTDAAAPDIAEDVYDQMVNYFNENSELNIQTGKFGAMMNVKLENDGPVTIILEK